MIQLAGAGEVRANDDYGLPVFGAGNSIGKRNSQRLCAEANGFDFSQRVGGQGLAVFSDDDYIGAIIPELGAQLGLHVNVKIHHRGGDGCGNDHGEQRGSGASAAEHSGAQKHAPEHGSVRRMSAAIRNLLRGCEAFRSALILHLAERRQDRISRRDEWRRRFRQRSQRRRWRG